MEDGGRTRAGQGGVLIFPPTFNPTSRIVAKIGDNFWDFGGVFLGLVGLGVILWSFWVILPPIIPRILPQSYDK